MEFRDFASRETTALVAQLLARQSEVSLHQLRAVREVLEAAAQAMATAAQPSSALEQGIDEVVRRLNTAAAAGVKAAAQRIQEDAQKAIDAAHAERDAQRTRTEQLTTILAQLEAHVQALEADLRVEKERADTSDRDLDAALEAHRELEAALGQAEAAGRQKAEARALVERELQDTRGLLEEALAESARLGGQLEREVAEKAAVTSDLFAAREEQEHLDAARARAEAALAQEAAARALTDGELATARAALDAAGSDAARLHDQIEDRTSEAASLRSELAAAHAELEHARSEIRALAAERDRLAGAHDVLMAAHEALRTQMATTAAERDRMAAARDAVAAERDAIAAERTAVAEQRDLLAAERDELAAARATLNASLETDRLRLQALEEDLSGRAEKIQLLERLLEDAAQAEARLHDGRATDQREVDRARSEAGAMREERDRTTALLRASLRGVERLAQATTAADLLSILVQQLALECPRVALFRVKGNRLEGEHQLGFDHTTDIGKLVLPMNVDSLPSRAATTGTCQSVPAGDLADGRLTPFGATPDAALALPVVVHGETLAIIYAEHAYAEHAAELPAADSAAGPAFEVFATLMGRHTTVLLIKLTEELRTLSALREYAAMLLQEARQMHEADTQAGRKDDEVRRRLEDTIECARQLYAQRAALEGTAAAALLDEQIASVIEADAGTPFARDLATVIGRPDLLEGNRSSREAAEAS